MALHTTQWSPETCGCVVTYTWDDAVPQDQRVHTPDQVVTTCSVHAGLAVADVQAAVWDENPRKNRVQSRALQLLTGTKFVKTVTNSDGSTYLDWADGFTFTWSFDANRVLVVSINGLTAAQKTSFQTAADNLVGAGKVRVQ